jgi:hypothetical protein
VLVIDVPGLATLKNRGKLADLFGTLPVISVIFVVI